MNTHPLTFTYWLRTARQVIGEDVDLGELWAQFLCGDDWEIKIADRIADLKREWSETTGDNPDDYALSGDDWRVGLTEDEATELEALLDTQAST